MATETITATTGGVKKTSLANTTFGRVIKYALVRLATLAVTVIIGIYLTILIANMGGYVDTIMRNGIRIIRHNPSLPTLLSAHWLLMRAKS